VEKSVDGDQLLVFGHSNWKTSGREDCELSGSSKTTEDFSLTIGARDPVFLNSEVFRKYSRKPITLSIIAAVTYILSKRLVELQGASESDSLSAGSAAPVIDKENPTSVLGSPDQIGVEIGDVDNDTIRWWQAILAQGRGWIAEVASEMGHWISGAGIHLHSKRTRCTNCRIFPSVSLPR